MKKLLLLTLLCWQVAVAGGEELPVEVDYNFHIKPILSDRCYRCHGPDATARQADLRLDLYAESLLTAGQGRAIIEPGSPQQSELYRRVASTDPQLRMPPDGAKLPPLSGDQVALIERWIEQGATWKRHWSLLPIAQARAPEVELASWPVNPIDQFVLAHLQRHSLKPSQPATSETLIRRVTFDLTGLAPTIEEVNQFLGDSSTDAYKRVVDRLLESPRYAERMAVYWLDLARYADTYGYQVDRDRHVWPWRDWVLQALDRNMPYDQFITWQIAGDLLPNATEEQILATTFNRLHAQKTEGGSTPEEFRVEYVADRTHTLGMALMGMTIECARCHDHKYDPITQQEYYQIFAFFNNIDEAGLYSNDTKSVPTPTLMFANKNSDGEKMAGLQNQVAETTAQLRRLWQSRQTAFDEWLSERKTEVSLPDQVAHYPFDRPEEGTYANLLDAESPATSSSANRTIPGKRDQAVLLTGDDAIKTSIGRFTRHEPFTVALWLQTPDAQERAVVFHCTKGFTDAGSRGYQLLIEKGRLSASLIHFWPGNAIRVLAAKPLTTGRWQHVAITYDGSSQAAGLSIFVDGTRQPVEIVRDNLTKTIERNQEKKGIEIGERNRDRGFPGGMIDDLQVFSRQLSALEIAQLVDGQSLALLLARPQNSLSLPERSSLFDYYLSAIDPVYRDALGALVGLRKEQGKLVKAREEIMVMRDMNQRRRTYILERGAYDAPTEPVEPGTPAALLPFPEDQPKNRLGLARWLTDPQHPLTARVAVNQFWQLCFGEGLVRTAEDFGSQGEVPTHPALLDWLARDFIDNHWNVKRLLKQMVMSSTYRQSSAPRDDLEDRDPENRLLARASRYRLSAEMIRDNALATSGLLTQKFGGPPALPYEVAVSFKARERGRGEHLYRRSLYTFWKRTGPAPVMRALDAAKRDVCVVKRERTSSALQALVLLNDVQLVEAARILGQRMILKYGAGPRNIAPSMFQTLTSRKPTEKETAILTALYDEQLEHFRQHPQAASDFLKVGDAPHAPSIDPAHLAAAGVLAKALFNYDGCLTKR
jgi:hypothetical protein